ncbi:MMPL family transporter [Nocardioides bruguierae]|uniref:MMPL family transporter n=1 Tax=Nocardioides bruguierae TaxID=2945102 RepID=A0A9X2D4I9_9ACTN|nr:MMPL family transporter [Nocardioides bruguierae]MCM0619257.1 MMPL family transporter [Nocardioides bruguierae]
MAWHLFRLGRGSFRHRRLVASLWLALLVAVGIAATTLGGETSDNFELDGIESTDAFSLIEDRTPDSGIDGATAQVVFQAPDGETLTDPANQQAVSDALAAVQTEDVVSVSDPFTTGTISQDGTVAYASVSYTVQAIEMTEADRDALDDVKTTGEDAGLLVAVGGDAVAPETAPPVGEVVGIAVALVVLTLTFGSLVAAGMPLLTALIGVGVGFLGITIMTGFVELSSTTPALGSMLGLAVGIDYALFIMSRYQHEVAEGRDREEAAGVAVGTAGSAVIFAGLTVIIALAGLTVVGIGFLTQMGVAAAAMVAVTVVLSLTLLPAILGFGGNRAIGRAARKAVAEEQAEASGTPAKAHLGTRWASFLSRFRWPAVVGGIALAAVVSIPVASMELALPDNGTAAEGSDARIAYDLISDNFGPGFNGPLVVVVDTAGADDPAAAYQTAFAELGGVSDDVTAIVPAVTSDSAKAQQAFAQQLDAVQFATITVIPSSGPSDQATKDLVSDIRSTLADLEDETGARALVTGQTAVGVDISDELAAAFPKYLLVVVGLAFVLLVLVFRSLLVPLKAALGFLLSVGISLGATVAVFQWGWLGSVIGLDGESPVMFLLPILLTGILFGLAMDYEVFLVTRMREAWVHGTEARRAVIDGFQHSSRVVVAAALIMIGVFAGFALADDVIIKSIGFALAIGVLADAFLVRMLIVPAVMAIIGERIWWMPRWLAKVLPNLDIEGEGLVRRLGHAPRSTGAGSTVDSPTGSAD